ncbi:hypothetical protein LUX33_38665 [Actinomadura madurae]|nr:hypothetical protein [Actinomadura madurae]MCP9953776.1 hypothetical protein [Actinomadura madurae]MCP9983004.1 hypothetical protein [Actinomadura madurae]
MNNTGIAACMTMPVTSPCAAETLSQTVAAVNANAIQRSARHRHGQPLQQQRDRHQGQDAEVDPGRDDPRLVAEPRLGDVLDGGERTVAAQARETGEEQAADPGQDALRPGQRLDRPRLVHRFLPPRGV